MEQKSQDRVHKAILTLLSLALAGAIAWVLFQASGFYLTAAGDRPHHPDYRLFRPAGPMGHNLGIVGSVMMVVLLFYSLRKRARFMRRWGDLRVWLRYHIFLGVAGPLLVTLHSSFRIGGLVAVSYWSMVAVAASGIFGRYLYQQIPRNVLGEHLAVAQVEQDQEKLLVELAERHQLDPAAQDRLDEVALGPFLGRSAIGGLFILPWHNLMLARRLQSWAEELETDQTQQAVALAKTWTLQSRRLHLFHLIRDLFHYWHVFHKPFAVIMLLIMVVHIAVALAFGFTGSEA